jgi:hypothetical protein
MNINLHVQILNNMGNLKILDVFIIRKYERNNKILYHLKITHIYWIHGGQGKW